MMVLGSWRIGNIPIASMPVPVRNRDQHVTLKTLSYLAQDYSKGHVLVFILTYLNHVYRGTLSSGAPPIVLQLTCRAPAHLLAVAQYSKGARLLEGSRAEIYPRASIRLHQFTGHQLVREPHRQPQLRLPLSPPPPIATVQTNGPLSVSTNEARSTGPKVRSQRVAVFR